jgi:hypothetical protein
MTATIEETLKNESSNNAVTEVFIRDAIDKSTVNALRLALYQATGDAILADMKVSKEPIRGRSDVRLCFVERGRRDS